MSPIQSNSLEPHLSHPSLDAVETRFIEIGMPSYAQAVEQIKYLVTYCPENFSVLIGDADGLKDINDSTDGHLAGDKIIIETGEALTEQTNKIGFVTLGRRNSLGSFMRENPLIDIGKYREPTTNHRKGDEFIVVLPSIKTQIEVDTWIDEVQLKLAARGIRLTLSGRPHMASETASDLLTGVDRLLKFDKGLRSVKEKTPHQLEVARKIGEMAAESGLSLRELPKVIGFLPFIPYSFETKTTSVSSTNPQAVPEDLFAL